MFYLLYNLAENYTYMSSDCVGLPEASGEGDVGTLFSDRCRVAEWQQPERETPSQVGVDLVKTLLAHRSPSTHRFNNQRCPHLTYVDSESNCNLLSDTKSCSGELI